MVNNITPIFNKVYFFDQCTAIYIQEGTGLIEVDFKYHKNWASKILFLDKGQFIRFLSDDFIVYTLKFDLLTINERKLSRVLFKHLLSLGYIHFDENKDRELINRENDVSNASNCISEFSHRWYAYNPFQASPEEYHLIFDTKDIIDNEYKSNLRSNELNAIVTKHALGGDLLFRDKIGISILELLRRKRLLESKRLVAFTDLSIKEIAYEQGFKDPAYFNRVFKLKVGRAPLEFRKDIDHSAEDTFVKNLFELIIQYCTSQRQASFYADKLHLSVKVFSKKVHNKLGISFGRLIRAFIIQHAEKLLLNTDYSIAEIAFELGFKEANHFSTFFKSYTNKTPSQIRD
ncbi:MAG: helix-turn-helix domain-containing protein [Bacteroidota bacterium]